jgi:hypothetical protein
MTAEEEARDALQAGKPRAVLSPAGQAEYDRLWQGAYSASTHGQGPPPGQPPDGLLQPGDPAWMQGRHGRRPTRMALRSPR